VIEFQIPNAESFNLILSFVFVVSLLSPNNCVFDSRS
jgi:hypothetical protein